MRQPPHVCSACGASSPRWTGRCATCGEWNTLVESRPERVAVPTVDASVPIPLAEVLAADAPATPTGIGELDRVLAGGFVPSSVTLLGGEPGIGKSTLVLQALAGVAASGRRALLVAAEESAAQVRQRAERLGPLASELWLVAEHRLPAIEEVVRALRPAVVAVDSIQTVFEPERNGSPGSLVQVREAGGRLVRLAKADGPVVLLVGHVTKDGAIAGPRVLEHLVDTVLSFEGERHHALRLLRALKHRFGPTGELGLFSMDPDGLAPVGDPSSLLLTDRRRGIPGSVVVAAMEGRRPLLVEVQALVSEPVSGPPRRSAQGLDAGRLALILAVLARRVGVELARADIFVSAVGGVRVQEPAADLSLALALASAAAGVALPEDVVAFGEVGLGGEVRQVAQTDRRLAEVARLGFRRAVLPASAPPAPAGIEELRVRGVAEAIDALGLWREQGAGRVTSGGLRALASLGNG